jgi:hypothetical protein
LGGYELGTETLIDRRNILACNDLTRPRPSVKLIRPIYDMSDSVARGLVEKIWASKLSFQNDSSLLA